MTKRRPSRIYAGNEPLPPVEPLVPLALTIVLFGVWWLRAFIVRTAVAHQGLRGHDSFRDAALESGATRGAVTTALTFLLIGAAACFAVLVRIRWRGRGVWGQVPLAYGMGVTAFALILTSWLSFLPEDGTLAPTLGMLEAVPFDAKLIFAACGLAFVLLATALVSRRWCTRGAPAASLACVALIAIPAAHVLVARIEPDLDPVTSTAFELPVVEGDFVREVHLPIQQGTLVYLLRSGEWWITRVPLWGEPLGPLMRVEESTSGERLVPELDAGELGGWAASRTQAFVMMRPDDPAAALGPVFRHARRFAPELKVIGLLGRAPGEPFRWTRAQGKGPLEGVFSLTARRLATLSVVPVEPSFEMGVRREPEGLSFDPPDALDRVTAMEEQAYARGDDFVGVTLHFDGDTTIRDLAPLFERMRELYHDQVAFTLP